MNCNLGEDFNCLGDVIFQRSKQWEKLHAGIRGFLMTPVYTLDNWVLTYTWPDVTWSLVHYEGFS